ncbi:uracil-DNA glycosylase family protein [uncultured Cocleimonas sp.]|uniref:uracil-DNA glycosylase family protein n=1 Tax=uncultured Cocleimonas sp. TaxID=1051587 RepID=UPI002617E891|nr:uracil-DNA glycosylase family protein [uncultured Cocleimonas sp.]
MATLLEQVRACRLCEKDLKHGVRPVLQVSENAKILIAGQAPGSKVHASGIPFDDPSGDRLRDWMGIDRETFYDSEKISILPMAFCYPGKGKSGDLPPRPICAETWREKLLSSMTDIQLTLVIGQYALAWHLEKPEKNLTETVKNWAAYGEQTIPLPHPSPRNNIWLKKNQWFETEVLPELRVRVQKALK